MSKKNNLVESGKLLSMLCSENNLTELEEVKMKLLKKHIKKAYANLTNNVIVSNQ